MSPVLFIDRSGESRSDEDVKAAIERVEKEIVRADFSNPELFVQLPTIREGLNELLKLRGVVREMFDKQRKGDIE